MSKSSVIYSHYIQGVILEGNEANGDLGKSGLKKVTVEDFVSIVFSRQTEYKIIDMLLDHRGIPAAIGKKKWWVKDPGLRRLMSQYSLYFEGTQSLVIPQIRSRSPSPISHPSPSPPSIFDPPEMKYTDTPNPYETIAIQPSDEEKRKKAEEQKKIEDEAKATKELVESKEAQEAERVRIAQQLLAQNEENERIRLKNAELSAKQKKKVEEDAAKLEAEKKQRLETEQKKAAEEVARIKTQKELENKTAAEAVARLRASKEIEAKAAAEAVAKIKTQKEIENKAAANATAQLKLAKEIENKAAAEAVAQLKLAIEIEAKAAAEAERVRLEEEQKAQREIIEAQALVKKIAEEKAAAKVQRRQRIEEETRKNAAALEEQRVRRQALEAEAEGKTRKEVVDQGILDAKKNTQNKLEEKRRVRLTANPTPVDESNTVNITPVKNGKAPTEGSNSQLKKKNREIAAALEAEKQRTAELAAAKEAAERTEKNRQNKAAEKAKKEAGKIAAHAAKKQEEKKDQKEKPKATGKTNKKNPAGPLDYMASRATESEAAKATRRLYFPDENTSTSDPIPDPLPAPIPTEPKQKKKTPVISESQEDDAVMEEPEEIKNDVEEILPAETLTTKKASDELYWAFFPEKRAVFLEELAKEFEEKKIELISLEKIKGKFQTSANDATGGLIAWMELTEWSKDPNRQFKDYKLVDTSDNKPFVDFEFTMQDEPTGDHYPFADDLKYRGITEQTDEEDYVVVKEYEKYLNHFKLVSWINETYPTEGDEEIEISYTLRNFMLLMLNEPELQSTHFINLQKTGVEGFTMIRGSDTGKHVMIVSVEISRVRVSIFYPSETWTKENLTQMKLAEKATRVKIDKFRLFEQANESSTPIDEGIIEGEQEAEDEYDAASDAEEKYDAAEEARTKPVEAVNEVVENTADAWNQ